jgi:nickel/cobalt transporter (NicO) family protein
MTLVAAAPKDSHLPLRLAAALVALLVAAIVIFGFGALLLGTTSTAPKNPFGVGIHEGAIGTSSLARWLLTQQDWFNRRMLDGLKAARDHSGFALGMILLAFGYGVFHAGGPGHGKAVISAYLVANEDALWRGIALSIASALLQSLVAIAIVLGAAVIVRATATGMTRLANYVETISFAAIAALGLVMTWRKAGPVAARMARREMASGMGHFGVIPELGADKHDRDGYGDHAQPLVVSLGHDERNRAHGAPAHEHRAHDHGHDGHAHCDHHVPVEFVQSRDFRWRDAAPVVFAAGSRPCSGAIIVLVFALSQGLLAVGLVAVLAMAAGVAVTVSALAALSVFARRMARRLAGGEEHFAFPGAVIELLAAAFVATIGLGLMSGLAMIGAG